MGGLKETISKTLAPGMTLGGCYCLVASIGQGGFGEVWKAQDTRSADIVAIKMPQHQFAIKPKVVESLKHECDILKTLAHPNICRLIDLAYDPVYGPLLVTEYVDGTNLETAARRLSWDDQMDLFIQALLGLEYLHSQPKPVMHLDVKPQNMMVSGDRLKLIDFGISGFKPPAKTAGTYSYMSPEMLVDANTVTAQADLYSLGIVMYQCLTGVQPFRTSDIEETKRLQREVYPKCPTEIRPGMPPWIDQFVMKLLQKNPSDRYGSAKEALLELPMLRGKPIENAAHLQSFAPASGSFIGRSDIREDVKGDCFIYIIQGHEGCGKTRMLREIKFDAQSNQVQTLVVRSASEATIEMLKPVTDAMITATIPVLILLDDYDDWFENAPGLARLLNTIQNHPGLPTLIRCVMSMTQVPDSWRATGTRVHELHPFTVQEVGEYLSAVAHVPEPQRSRMAEQLWQHTHGNPGHLAKTMMQLIEQRYFASGAGQWDPSLFEDVTIEVTNSSDANESVAPPQDVPRFLVEAAESALARGKVSEALGEFERFPDCHDGVVMLWKGILLTSNGNFDAARQVLAEALAMAFSANDKVLELRVRNQLASILFKSGKSEEAIEAYRQTASEESLLDASARDSILNNDLGNLLLQAGCFDEASRFLKELMVRAERSGKSRRAILSQVQLGSCLMHLSERMNEARVVLLSAIQKARTVQQQDLLSYAYNQLANSYVMGCDQEAAVEILKRAIPLNYFLNDLRSVATNTTNYGLGLIRNGEYEEAKHKLQVAHEYIKTNEDLIKECMVPCLVGQAEIAKHEGKLADADALLTQAETIAHQYRAWDTHAYSILMTRAENRRDDGDVLQAKALALQAEPFARPGRERREWEDFIMAMSIIQC